MQACKEIIAIMIGGGAGATCRHLINIYLHRLAGTALPYGTITVNLTGSLCIGLFGALLEHYKVAAEYRLFLLTGFFGSFTTFSTFAREKAELLKMGDIKTAILYALSINVLGVLLVFAGYILAKQIIELSA